MSEFSISLIGGSHQHMGAAIHIIDMVWLYIACLSQWGGGDILLVIYAIGAGITAAAGTRLALQ